MAVAANGVNDAPALTETDVGSAIGTGTEVTMQSAGITLGKGDLAGIARAWTLSRMTMPSTGQSLILAAVAARVLYPFFGILRSPVAAALVMSLNSASDIGNALRLARL